MTHPDIPAVTGENDEQSPAVAPEPPSARDRRGRFQKGAPSGNPKGRPTESHEMKELARDKSKEAIGRLVFWMRSADPTASIAAAKELLSRGYGRPEQGITLDAAIANYTQPFAGAVETVTGPVEAMRAYQEIIQGNLDPRSVEIVSVHKALVALDPPPVRPIPTPAPIPISRAAPTGDVQARRPPEPRTVDQEYLPAEPQPPSDMSKATMELWIKLGQPSTPQEALSALDAALRHKRPPRVPM